jgi:1-acyl-sn-glycerol-3-phosphate acyltransferase
LPPPALYRVIRAACIAVVRLVFDVQVAGREHMPPPGSIVAGVPHRNWVEPMLLVALLPARPRLVMLADGQTVSSSALRRLLVRAVGGVIPVGPGRTAAGFEAIGRAAQAAVNDRAVLALFPEVGKPAKAPRLRRLSPGVCQLASRTDAPVVPVVFGGTHELYLRRRIVVRILPPIQPMAPGDAGGCRAGMDAFMADFRAVVQAAAVEAHESAEADSPRRKRWRWLTGNYPRAD